MSEEQLKKKVDEILDISWDDERAHSYEDDLHLEVIDQFCPDWVKKEVDRLTDGDFQRWCA